jgi:hypothetical protein
MSAHTPGPWTPRGGGSNYHPHEKNRADMMDWRSGVDAEVPFTETDGSREDVQSVAAGYGRTLAEAEANARLIAAAPELLEACQSARESIEQLVRLNRIPANNKGLRDVIAAIAKATGGAA